MRLCRLHLFAVYSHFFTVCLLLDSLYIDDYSQLILGSHTTVIFIVPLHYFVNLVILLSRYFIVSLLVFYFYQTYTALCAGNLILFPVKRIGKYTTYTQLPFPFLRSGLACFLSTLGGGNEALEQHWFGGAPTINLAYISNHNS